ncbi:mucin-5AC-like [Anopheles moucheti]|uniref:mucin-5AC-like n=1 Tax=Anopheles moucheti TaxID=186751 RepID=UPI0022F07DB3|nr:mucin-5AC-like [Anopheles moucheti]
MGLAANNLTLIIRIWLAVIIFQYGHSENVEPRALELSVPWRPIPYHVPQQQLQQSQQPQQLISVASFDTTSKDELVHIAQHNAQILKQFNQPIAQYSQHSQGGMKVQITTHQQAPGPSPAASVQQQHHQHHHHHLQHGAPSFGHTPAGPPKYMTTPLLQTIYPGAPHKQQQSPAQSKPFVKSDQITTLNMVHSSTPKITAAISSHGAVGVKSAKFNGQFRDVQPTIVQKSTLKPHPVMNKLQSHLGITGFRQKQPVATSSNRLEHFINPNHLYGTYIQFGQSPALSPASLAPTKTKYLSQLGSGVPTFDTQTLKSFFNAPGYTPSVGQFKKLNFIQQQQQLQQGAASGKFSFPHFNQIPADLAEFPKKYVTPSSAEKELTKTGSGGLDSTPLFPHLPPSVLTPFFQQVQQQQQQHSSSSSFISGNKYNNFNLKTQHPAPPVASQSSSTAGSSTKHSFTQGQFQSDREPLSNFGSQVFGGGAFSAYSTQQPLPIEHKPYEVLKFKESPGKQLSTKFNEIHDEYSKNLVPPPPSTQQAFLPTVLNHLAESSPSKDPIEILNKYNINPHSPLQDANRFSYDFPRPTPVSHAASTSGPVPTTVSTTTTTTTTQFPTATTLPRQQYYQHHYSQFQFPGEQSFHNHQSSSPVLVTPVNELSENGWFTREKYLTTEKPNVFKNLFRPVESEYKQHKLMHPAYTGLPPNRRPTATASSTTTSTSAGPTTNSPWDQSTEEPIITHSFFTIEDAIADPTLIPPRSKNKYKYTTDAEEENRQEDLQLEIVTIGPFFGSEESPIQQVVTTPAPTRAQGSKGANGQQHRRRRPKPHHQSSTTTEYTTEQDSTESTTNAISPSLNTVDNRNRNRIRFRPKPVTTVISPIAAIVETEAATTNLPTPPPLPTFVSSEEFDGAVIKKFRKKPHFTRNRFNVLSQREEEKNSVLDQTEPSLATPTLTTISSTSTLTSAAASVPAEASPSLPPLGGGFRSRYRPAAPQQKGKDSQEDTQSINGDGLKLNSRLPGRLPPTAASSTVATSTDTASVALFNSDESNINSSEPQNRTRGGEHNRPRFSIKEYRNKLNRTVTSTAGPTSTAASPVGDLETTTAPKLRFPTRNRFLVNARLNKTVESNDIVPTGTGGVTTEKTANETTTRSSFRPHGTRTYNRFTVKKPSTESPQTSTAAGTATRGQASNGANLATRGRTKTAYDQAVAANRTLAAGTYNTTASLINRRPPKITLRQRIQNYNRKKEMEQTNTAAGAASEDALKRGDEVADIPSVDQNSVLASSGELNRPIDDLGTLGDRFESSNSGTDDVTTRSSTTESYRHHETAIMKISPKDPNSATAATNGEDYDLNSASSDYSKRVVELTLSGTGTKDRGNFKSVNKGLLSRKVPGYFTLATEDPILPIEAFFPQVKKPSGGLA